MQRLGGFPGMELQTRTRGPGYLVEISPIEIEIKRESNIQHDEWLNSQMEVAQLPGCVETRRSGASHGCRLPVS